MPKVDSPVIPVSIEPESETFVRLASDMKVPVVLVNVAESANAVTEAHNASEANSRAHRTFTRLPPTAKSLGHVPGDQNPSAANFVPKTRSQRLKPTRDCIKAIANSPNGFKEGGLGSVGFDLAANPTYTGIDASRRDKLHFSPNCIE
jgi:hypothetical protein